MLLPSELEGFLSVLSIQNLDDEKTIGQCFTAVVMDGDSLRFDLTMSREHMDEFSEDIRKCLAEALCQEQCSPPVIRQSPQFDAEEALMVSFEIKDSDTYQVSKCSDRFIYRQSNNLAAENHQ